MRSSREVQSSSTLWFCGVTSPGAAGASLGGAGAAPSTSIGSDISSISPLLPWELDGRCDFLRVPFIGRLTVTSQAEGPVDFAAQEPVTGWSSIVPCAEMARPPPAQTGDIQD
jgi:hypothetical protein